MIAETKGSNDTWKIETAKTGCAKKLFNKLSGTDVVYDVVTSYSELLNVMEKA